MNPYANTANAYKQVEINSVNRLKLVVMVYDAAIASLKQAVASHTRNDTHRRNQHISRAQFIVYELNNALDLQRGGKIAATLRDLYHFFNRQLNEALNDDDIGKIDDSLKLMTSLRESWAEISQKNITAEGALNNDAAVFHRDLNASL